MNPTYYAKTDEAGRAEFRTWLKNMLHMGPVLVTFTKTDGTERELNCTLKEGDTIPYVKTTDRVKKINEEVCPVWDIDKQEWRSFKYESVTKVNINMGS